MTQCTAENNKKTECSCKVKNESVNNRGISETESSVEIVAEVAGFSKEEIEISVIDNLLSLKCSKPAVEKAGRKLIHSEFRTADIEKQYALSEKIDTESIQAELKNGVLKLLLKKVPKTQPRKITIS